MARPKSLEPKYCLHKRSGLAYVTIDGVERYLGTYDTVESRDEYRRVISEWAARGRRPEPAPDPAAVIIVTQIVVEFWAHAQQEYPDPTYTDERRTAGKRPKGELGNYWDALRPLRRLYGATAAAEFGPLKLKAVREEMIRLGWCRNVVNRHTARLKHVFKWAAEQELVPGGVAQNVWAVKGLKAGKSAAPETDPVKPVPEVYVDAVLNLVSRQVKTMIQLQLLTGMRPGEACAIRTRDVDTSGKLWIYRPAKHKTQHHGCQREIRLGPKAKELLAPFLKPDLEAYVFSPAEAEAERRQRQHEKRKTAVRAWEHRQDKARAAARPRLRRPSDRYTVGTYRNAIIRACRRTDRLAHEQDLTLKPEIVVVPVWHPNQLRHNAGTRLRREFGLEVAQVILGHRMLSSTQVYAERDVETAEAVMAKIG